MKKHLIAAAVAAAVAVPAMAQNVSVYGLFDAGYATSKITHGDLVTKQTAIGGLHSANGTGTLSGSRLGFRGSEDLGGGLKANFVYELGINYSQGIAATTSPANNAANIGLNGAGMGNVRQGFVELAGGFGSVRIGTQNTLMKDSTEAIDPLGGVTLTGAASMYQAGVNGRRDTITYATPNLNGFTVRAQAYFGENTSGGTDDVAKTNKGSAISANYINGPLRVEAIAERIKNQTYAANGNRLVSLQSDSVTYFTTATATTIDKANYDAVGASYNLGPATLHALTTKLKLKDDIDNAEVTSTLVGVTIPVTGAFSVRGSITTGKITDDGSHTYDLDGYQLVGQYDLSKRTHAYVALGQTKYDATDNAIGGDVKAKQFGIGLRHSF